MLVELNDKIVEVIKNPKYYFIELPKFRKKKPDLNNILEQWLLFLDHYNKEEIKKLK